MPALTEALKNDTGKWFFRDESTGENWEARQYIWIGASPSVKGTMVRGSTTTENAVEITLLDCVCPMGVIVEDGVTNGNPVWVASSGKVPVLLEDSTSATKGYWARTSVLQAGRADATNILPPGGTIGALEQHNNEIGHVHSDVTAGIDKTAIITMHFN